MSNARQTSAAIAVGVLAGLVVCLSSIVPIWVAGTDWRDERTGTVAGVLPILWVAVSAGAGSFYAGSSGWSTLRAMVLGVFGWLGLFLSVPVLSLLLMTLTNQEPTLTWPTIWQWLIFWACVGLPAGAYLGVAVTKRQLSEDAHVDRNGRYNWAKISIRCGVLGLLLFVLLLQEEGESGAWGRLFFGPPVLFISTVAVVGGLWTRTALGWILGLVPWAWLLIRIIRNQL